MVEKKDCPDFLLAGAMKSGSTTLYNILDQNPDISMVSEKDNEFFGRNDSLTHTSYAINYTNKWANFKIEEESSWKKYLKLFPEDSRLKGGASVSYMNSIKAIKQVKKYLKNPKAIFILRDPVERAYSHYWHQLRQSRTLYSFKTSLERDRNIFDFSVYPDKIRAWEDSLGEKNIHILLLEELVDRPQETMDNLFNFLNVSSCKINLPKKYAGSFPKFPRVYRLFNALLYVLGKKFTSTNLDENDYWTLPEKAFRKIILTDNKPDLDNKLRKKLETIFYHENKEILEWKPEAKKYWSIF